MFDGPDNQPQPQPAQPVQPHPLEMAFGQEFMALQLALQHVNVSGGGLMAEWRRDRAMIAQMKLRIAELEAELAAARQTAGLDEVVE